MSSPNMEGQTGLKPSPETSQTKQGVMDSPAKESQPVVGVQENRGGGGGGGEEER